MPAQLKQMLVHACMMFYFVPHTIARLECSEGMSSEAARTERELIGTIRLFGIDQPGQLAKIAHRLSMVYTFLAPK